MVLLRSCESCAWGKVPTNSSFGHKFIHMHFQTQTLILIIQCDKIKKNKKNPNTSINVSCMKLRPHLLIIRVEMQLILKGSQKTFLLILSLNFGTISSGFRRPWQLTKRHHHHAVVGVCWPSPEWRTCWYCWAERNQFCRLLYSLKLESKLTKTRHVQPGRSCGVTASLKYSNCG